MKTIENRTRGLLLALVALLSPCANSHAWAPNNSDLEAAVNAGDFSAYFANLSAWLTQQVPADSSRISEPAMKALFKNSVLANALDQRQLLVKVGVANVGAFARANPDNQMFLAWLLRNTQAMDLYLEGATPTGIKDRELNRYTLSAASMDIWKRIFFADPESKEGMDLRLAIATALRPPGTGNRGAGQAATPADPVERYKHFKAAHQNKELFPSFDGLTVWEYQQVVSSCASDGDLAWAREMINTWRPDLRIHEQVVNSTSEVWRRDSPHPYTNGYRSVLSGGGKCGPRSSWSVMVCQAFGIPAIGVGQPAHACVAYKAHDASLQPQPGNIWKVGYGRGWQVSKLDGLSGPDFLAGVEERSRVAEFSQVEHLRWLASALASTDQAAAVMQVAHKIQQSAPAAKVDLTASEKAAEAEKELEPVKAAAAPATISRAPVKLAQGGTRIEAAAFSKLSGVRVYDCFTGGKQLNFEKNVKESWMDYALDVPATGTYALQMRTATPNFDQVLDISTGAAKLATVKVPNTAGLWGTTSAVDVKLDKGLQTVRVSAPFQRGVAVRWFELKAK